MNTRPFSLKYCKLELEPHVQPASVAKSEPVGAGTFWSEPEPV